MVMDNVDPDMVESLVKGASSGMNKALIPNITTSDEVVSAAFTFLDRTLRAARKLQSAKDRFHSASEINRVLNEMLVDFGKVPS